MPPDAQASQYFHYFFENVHPYVPVLYPPYLFRHWDENKSSISPLILEAIFSCSARMLNQTTESDRWLALAKSKSLRRHYPVHISNWLSLRA